MAAMLFTGTALIGALLAGVAAWLAIRAANDAHHSAQQLLRSQGKLVALDDRQTALEASLRKLHGRVAAHRRWDAGDGGDEYEPARRAIERGGEIPPPSTPPRAPTNGVIDPELEAELALQRAPVVAPGR